MKGWLRQAREDYELVIGALQPKWDDLGPWQRMAIADEATDGPIWTRTHRLSPTADITAEAWWMWTAGGIGIEWTWDCPPSPATSRRAAVALVLGPLHLSAAVEWSMVAAVVARRVAAAAAGEVWRPGDPCASCGSSRTTITVLGAAHCGNCERTDES